MKKVSCLIIIFISILLFTGCTSHKEAIDSEKFTMIMEEENYYVSNLTDYFSEYNCIKNALSAENQENNY